MLVRIYEACWALFFVVALVIFFTGNLGGLSAVALGFVGFGLVFMGMISVLPDIASHPSHK